MAKKKTIVVTQRDIENGEACYDHCPVGLAIRRAFRAKPDRPVWVRHEVAQVGRFEDDVMWVAIMPPEVDRFITRFDAGKPVKPFAFTAEFV